MDIRFPKVSSYQSAVHAASRERPQASLVERTIEFGTTLVHE
jgi:hypothetical protein